jgi:hypothetical protein
LALTDSIVSGVRASHLLWSRRPREQAALGDARSRACAGARGLPELAASAPCEQLLTYQVHRRRSGALDAVAVAIADAYPMRGRRAPDAMIDV